jgi:transcriptional regulator with XRE-family HTH domain
MELVAIDGSGVATKNVRVTKEERVRIGRKLRALRVERGLDQAAIAADAKVGIGTLQAIEGAWYDVRDHNIEKYARFLGTTLTKLLKADQPQVAAPSDPLLKDLNEEHLEIARSYMRARKRVRTCIELLLTHPAEEALTSLVMKLERFPADHLARIEGMLYVDPDGMIGHLLERVRLLLLTDDDFVGLLEGTLEQLDRQRVAQVEPHKKSRRAATRSA